MIPATEPNPPPEVLIAMRRAMLSAALRPGERRPGQSIIAAAYPVWRAWRDSLGTAARREARSGQQAGQQAVETLESQR